MLHDSIRLFCKRGNLSKVADSSSKRRREASLENVTQLHSVFPKMSSIRHSSQPQGRCDSEDRTSNSIEIGGSFHFALCGQWIGTAPTGAKLSAWCWFWLKDCRALDSMTKLAVYNLLLVFSLKIILHLSSVSHSQKIIRFCSVTLQHCTWQLGKTLYHLDSYLFLSKELLLKFKIKRHRKTRNKQLSKTLAFKKVESVGKED